MLVTFKTHAHADITMFGNPAVKLLKLMGQSGNVPGAILAGDVPKALESLLKGLQAIEPNTDEADQSPTANQFDDSDQSAVVGLDQRAAPLIQLLQAAVKEQDSVTWEN